VPHFIQKEIFPIKPNALKVFITCLFIVPIVEFVAIFPLFELILLLFVFPYHLSSSLVLFRCVFVIDQPKTFHQSKFLLRTSKFETFVKSMSHLGMSFQDSGLANLLLNKHNGLNVQKTMEMLRLVWFRYYKSCIL